VFHTPTGDANVPTLAQNKELRYGAGAGFRAAELPYDGGQLGMVVVVPDDLATFEANLTGATFTAITASLHEAQLDLKLPKFRFDAPLGLKETLQNLGMTQAFTDQADLSGIDGELGLHVGDVLHKGFVAIDEHGTEAAAATAVIIDTDSAPEPAALTVDRPFVFFIRDIPTGTILFVGRVVDPR
jgi:serpin B